MIEYSQSKPQPQYHRLAAAKANAAAAAKAAAAAAAAAVTAPPQPPPQPQSGIAFLARSQPPQVAQVQAQPQQVAMVPNAHVVKIDIEDEVDDEGHLRLDGLWSEVPLPAAPPPLPPSTALPTCPPLRSPWTPPIVS